MKLKFESKFELNSLIIGNGRFNQVELIIKWMQQHPWKKKEVKEKNKSSSIINHDDFKRIDINIF